MNKKRGIAVGLIAAGVVAGLLLFFFLGMQHPASFPSIPPGSYVGTISGLVQKSANSSEDISQQRITMYLERLRGSETVLLVLFKPGWKTKLIPLYLHEGQVAINEQLGYRPLKLPGSFSHITLQGSRTKNGFSGIVEAEGIPIGDWQITAATNEQLLAERPQLPEQFDFAAWLRMKGRHRIRAEELAALNRVLSEEQSQLQQVRARLANKELLQTVSESYHQELQKKLEALQQTESETRKRVNELVQELEQLQRITVDGRSMELARRVVTREDKWYQVNWAQTEEGGAVEESLANSMNIDMRKLNERYERAREIKRLKNQIAKERALVRELERRYRERLEESKEQEKEKKPWWRNWDSIF